MLGKHVFPSPHGFEAQELVPSHRKTAAGHSLQKLQRPIAATHQERPGGAECREWWDLWLVLKDKLNINTYVYIYIHTYTCVCVCVCVDLYIYTHILQKSETYPPLADSKDVVMSGNIWIYPWYTPVYPGYWCERGCNIMKYLDRP
jgi:hypothetical protein